MTTPNKISFMPENYVQSVGFSAPVLASEAALHALGSEQLYGVCVDNAGIIYTTDMVKHAIFKTTPDGKTRLLAGKPGTAGRNGSTAVTLANARFNAPRGITVDARGNLYVADTGNNQIRKIAIDGNVTLLAGDIYGIAGYTNGTAARFNAPVGITVDASNVIYVADTGNNCVRKFQIGPNNVVTIAGTNASGDVVGVGTVARFNAPRAICVDQAGTVFVGDTGNKKVKRVAQSGLTTLVGSSFNIINYICTDKSRNLFVIDQDEDVGSRVIKVDYNGNKHVETTTSLTQICAAYIDRSGKIKIVESAYYVPAMVSSSSSSSSSSILISRSSASSKSTESSSSIELSRSSASTESSSSSSSSSMISSESSSFSTASFSSASSESSSSSSSSSGA